jgi:hypothetical protein
VKRVPSRTLLFGAHVILMLCSISVAVGDNSGPVAAHNGARIVTYRDPTALYRLESTSITSLLAPPPDFKLGVATFPAMLLRLLSAMWLSVPTFVMGVRVSTRWDPCGSNVCFPSRSESLKADRRLRKNNAE